MNKSDNIIRDFLNNSDYDYISTTDRALSDEMVIDEGYTYIGVENGRFYHTINNFLCKLIEKEV